MLLVGLPVIMNYDLIHSVFLISIQALPCCRDQSLGACIFIIIFCGTIGSTETSGMSMSPNRSEGLKELVLLSPQLGQECRQPDLNRRSRTPNL